MTNVTKERLEELRTYAAEAGIIVSDESLADIERLTNRISDLATSERQPIDSFVVFDRADASLLRRVAILLSVPGVILEKGGFGEDAEAIGTCMKLLMELADRVDLAHDKQDLLEGLYQLADWKEV